VIAALDPGDHVVSLGGSVSGAYIPEYTGFAAEDATFTYQVHVVPHG
jgi:hypothetical protein